jgi:hypothetical protein
MIASHKLAAFAIGFAIAYPIIYVIVFHLNLALFTYHPALGEFGLGPDRPRQGTPAMYWFGWIATSAIGAAAIAAIAAVWPERLTRRLPVMLAWLVPLAAMVTAAGLMGHFFLR